MRALVMLFLIPCLAYPLTRRCPDYQRASELMSTRTFREQSRALQASTGQREIRLSFNDVNQAREYAYNFPALREWGFIGDQRTLASPYISRLESSSLHQRPVGRTFRKENGDVAVVRLDWDPDKGAHYNINITRHTPQGRENYRLAISFDCGPAPCTEAQTLRMIQRQYPD